MTDNRKGTAVRTIRCQCRLIKTPAHNIAVKAESLLYFYYNLIIFAAMLDPKFFFGAKPQNSEVKNKYCFVNGSPQKPVAIDKIVEGHPKSKWDEPLTIPSILYSKFNLAMPVTQRKRQEKSYPSSLLDYIKRAYERCQNEIDSKNMEAELRKIIANFEDDLTQVSWQTYPLPYIPFSNPAKPTQLRSTSQVNLDRKAQIRFPSSYRIMDEDKPSKAKILAQKRLEKLNMNLSNEEKGDDKPKQKTFTIGFQKTPVPLPPPPAPLPPPPAQKTNETKEEESYKYFIPLNLPKKETREAKEVKAGKETKAKKAQKKINKKQMQLVMKSTEEDEKIDIVARRFIEFNKIKQSKDQQGRVLQGEQNPELTDRIVGKSKSIQKSYLRITGRPDLETVRPEPVLKKALKHFLQAYKNGTHSYDYIISQLRSIRQDLTVQDIKNSFTVHVYEQNFKISLFENDQTQFKSLQTKLWQFYCQGLYYSRENRVKSYGYQMISLVLENKAQDLEYMMTRMDPDELALPEIQDKLRLRRVMMLGNYHAFFDYYNKSDHVSRCLLSHYIDRVRIKCLLTACRSFGEKIKVTVLSSIIGEDEDVMESLIKQQKATLQNGYLLLKPSYEKFLNSDHLVKKKVTVLLE